TQQSPCRLQVGPTVQGSPPATQRTVAARRRSGRTKATFSRRTGESVDGDERIYAESPGGASYCDDTCSASACSGGSTSALQTALSSAAGPSDANATKAGP